MFFRHIFPLILASASPRRKQFLAELGLSFAIVQAEVSEDLIPCEQAEHYVSRLARQKAAWVSSQYPDCAVLAADTVVCLGELILGKPQDTEDAVRMLEQLSGKKHTVRTGYCITCQSRSLNYQMVVSTDVWFVELTEKLIKAYVAEGESMDKAGAYGIQGKGACLIEKIDGSYTNVVGLPLAEVIQDLISLKIIEPTAV